MIIWRFIDGRPGHENQTQGLIQALQALDVFTVFDIDVMQHPSKPWHWLQKSFPPGEKLPTPDLLIGAGHSTHWPMLVARHGFGGRIIVLMKPSLPQRWFDLCVIPEHDRPVEGRTVFLTKGVLNKINFYGNRDEFGQGLILLGGPSKEYGWDDEQIKAQLTSIITQSDTKKWTVSGSQRTPENALLCLQDIPGVDVIRHTDDLDITQLIAKASQIWVTEDSVSMVYEALSSGAAIGLLSVPRIRVGRVAHGIDKLVADQLVPSPGSLQLNKAAQPLNEAKRCAKWIQSQWLNN